MIKLGGGSFTPGAIETVSTTELDTTATSATMKLGTLEVSGSLAGSTWSFTFTADQSGSLKPFTRYNPQVVYNSGESVEVRLETGPRKEATAAVAPPSATVVAQITGGTGIDTAPADGITDKGSVSVDTSWLATQIAAATITVAPEPGASNRVTTNLKAWSNAQQEMVSLIAETFYRAYGGTESTGSVLLKTGVEAAYSYYGYTIRENGAKRSLPFNSTGDSSGIAVTTSGQMYLNRGGNLDDAGDGYLVSVLYIDNE